MVVLCNEPWNNYLVCECVIDRVLLVASSSLQLSQRSCREYTIDLLLWSMPRETEAFFGEVLRENRSVLEFVESDWTMLNARLAQLYGIEGVDGSRLRKVSLPAGSHRGGVMTQASVLKVTADGTRTSPVLRGAWILDRSNMEEAPGKVGHAMLESGAGHSL